MGSDAAVWTGSIATLLAIIVALFKEQLGGCPRIANSARQT